MDLVTARRSLTRGPPQTSDTATIRAFFVAPLVRELGNSGVPVDAFLRRYGLSAAQLTSLYERVPLQHFVALAEDAARRLERPILRPRAGQEFQVGRPGSLLCDVYPRPRPAVRVGPSRALSVGLADQHDVGVLRGNGTSVYRYCIQVPSICPDGRMPSSSWHPSPLSSAS